MIIPSPYKILCTAITLLIFLLAPAWANEEKIQWVWAGGVTADEATISAQSLVPDVQLVLNSGADRPETGIAALSSTLLNHKHILRYRLSSLLPDTLYNYHFVSLEGKPLSSRFSFKTFPAPEKPLSFRFVFGSCNKQLGSKVFQAALNQKVLFFLHTGDFHYANIGDNNPSTFHKVFQTHLQNPLLNTMLQSLPLFYMWDDHDFGPNDSNRNNPSKEAAHSNYRTLVPHFPLQVPGTIDQAFTVGRVRFILSDLRSERDPETRTMISGSQMDWLKKELLACKGRYPLIFWISSVPWNGVPGGQDRWQGYTKQREEIATFARDQGITGICVLTGDAHMTAIDDGKNSDFAPGGGAPFRVFNAGPVAANGSYKAGPYSHGANFEGKFLQQFGLIDIKDEGGAISVSWSGRDGSDGVGDTVLTSQKDAEGLIELSFTIP